MYMCEKERPASGLCVLGGWVWVGVGGVDTYEVKHGRQQSGQHVGGWGDVQLLHGVSTDSAFGLPAHVCLCTFCTCLQAPVSRLPDAPGRKVL